MEQTVRSFSVGMGALGKKRLTLYLKGYKSRGYRSLSACVVALLDKEFDIELPKSSRRDSRELAMQKV